MRERWVSTILRFSNVVGHFSTWAVVTALAPTAASVGISGRIVDSNGYGIAKVRVTLADGTGQARIALTNGFGYFRFDNIQAGATYIVEAFAKRYQFANNP